MKWLGKGAFFIVCMAIAALLSLRGWQVTMLPSDCVSTPSELTPHIPSWLWQTGEKEVFIQSLPCLEGARFTAKYPARIVVEVLKRQAVVILIASESASTARFLVDRRGYVFDTTYETRQLPVVESLLPVVVGERFQELDGVEWQRLTEEIRRHLGTVDVLVLGRLGDLEIRVAGTTVLVPLDSSVYERLPTVASVLSRASRDGTMLKKIDYRFDRPVLLY